MIQKGVVKSSEKDKHTKRLIYMDKLIIKRTIRNKVEPTAADFLAFETGLSKGKVKDAMNKGAAWIGKETGSMQRLRKATTQLRTGGRIEFYYDENLLAIKPPQAKCIADRKQYSVWFKPAGLMAQGTMFGDHCSLLRQAEISIGNQREIFLVHRLDREAAGLMIFAHNKKTAAKLSELFQKNLIEKKYRIEVLGKLSEKSAKGAITLPLEDKPAITEYEVEAYSPESNTSTVDVTIRTGRLHQIRRHFEMLGYPVMGDPKYGKGNKNKEGMKLVAYSLAFICPISKKEAIFTTSGS
jgi:tRNA pseudouridine32 synthase/23S rRNA pseudouridine746 synthase